MNTMDRITRTLVWIARITGTLLLAFLLFMLIGHLTGDANGPNGMTFASNTDLLGFLLFPIGSIIGLGLAYKWKILGGTIAIASMAALYVLRPDLLQSYFVALALPAALYVLSGWLQLRSRKPANI